MCTNYSGLSIKTMEASYDVVGGTHHATHREHDSNYRRRLRDWPRVRRGIPRTRESGRDRRAPERSARRNGRIESRYEVRGSRHHGWSSDPRLRPESDPRLPGPERRDSERRHYEAGDPATGKRRGCRGYSDNEPPRADPTDGRAPSAPRETALSRHHDGFI